MVSIIICTRNRVEILAECLQAILNLEMDKNCYEIVLVDNNSSDNTFQFAKKILSHLPHHQVILEDKIGLGFARNTGFKAAKSSFVTYVDDDAIVNSNYLERVFWLVNNIEFDALGGRYFPWYKFGKPKWFKDEWGGNKCWANEIIELKAGFISGGISIFRKKILEELGGFPTDLGMTGNKIAYGEETLLQVRMREKGYKIYFDPELQMRHLVPKYKLKISWFIKSAFAQGRDSWKAQNTKPNFFLIFKIILKIFLDFFKNIFLSVFKLFQKNYFFQNFLIDVFQPLAFGMGRMFYWK